MKPNFVYQFYGFRRINVIIDIAKLKCCQMFLVFLRRNKTVLWIINIAKLILVIRKKKYGLRTYVEDFWKI